MPEGDWPPPGRARPEDDAILASSVDAPWTIVRLVKGPSEIASVASPEEPTQHRATLPAVRELAIRTARGVVPTALAQAGKIGLSLAALGLFARLLTPTEIGLVGMVSALVSASTLYRNVGLSIAVLQHGDLRAGQVD